MDGIWEMTVGKKKTTENLNSQRKRKERLGKKWKKGGKIGSDENSGVREKLDSESLKIEKPYRSCHDRTVSQVELSGVATGLIAGAIFPFETMSQKVKRHVGKSSFQFSLS